MSCHTHKFLKNGILFFLILCFTIFYSCTVGPDYIRPNATIIPNNYANDTLKWKIAKPEDNISRDYWWNIFKDTTLNRLEEDALKANQNIIAAIAAYERARAQANVAFSGIFPDITFAANANRQQDSENRPLSNTGQAAGTGYTYNNISIPFNMHYEFDLWGKIRRRLESTRANLQASAEYLEWVKLQITAEVAADYFSLRALETEKVILDSTVEIYKRSLQIVLNRRLSGLASDLDVAQAETIYKTTTALLPDNQLKQIKFKNALAVLTGKNASLFKINYLPLDIIPPIIPAGIPSELLERRPDIASAERRMAAANANIGIVTAAFYPSFNLNGLAGVQSLSTSSLFKIPSEFWAIGMSLSVPLFDGGKLGAQLNEAESAYAGTVANYRQTVLAAFADVENNLSAQKFLAESHASYKDALVSAKKQYSIAENKYRVGLITYLPVSSAAAGVLSLQSIVNRLYIERLVATVALIKSLGGKW